MGWVFKEVLTNEQRWLNRISKRRTGPLLKRKLKITINGIMWCGVWLVLLIVPCPAPASGQMSVCQGAPTNPGPAACRNTTGFGGRRDRKWRNVHRALYCAPWFNFCQPDPHSPQLYTAHIDTNVHPGIHNQAAGPITLQVNRSWAPLGSDCFCALLRDRYYDGAGFFRLVPSFVHVV